MSDLNQEFLNEYIRLEKLCKDLYKDLPREELKGILNYTQDMENTPMHISRKIPDWDFHFEELVRLRKTRNKREHEEDGRKNHPVTQEDIEYLRDFRQSILNQTDPISQAHRNSKKSNTTTKKAVSKSTYCYEQRGRRPEKKKKPLRSFFEFLLWAVFTLGISGILIYFINEIFSIF